MSAYTRTSNAAYPIALGCTRGCYQRALLDGNQAWSGMTLRGRAADYRTKYQDSAYNFLERLKACPDLEVRQITGHHNRKEVEIGLAGEMFSDPTGEDAKALADLHLVA